MAEELLQPLPSFLPDPKAALHPNFSLLRDAPAAPSPLSAQGLTKTSAGREPGCSGTYLPRAHPDNPQLFKPPDPLPSPPPGLSRPNRVMFSRNLCRRRSTSPSWQGCHFLWCHVFFLCRYDSFSSLDILDFFLPDMLIFPVDGQPFPCHLGYASLTGCAHHPLDVFAFPVDRLVFPHWTRLFFN